MKQGIPLKSLWFGWVLEDYYILFIWWPAVKPMSSVLFSSMLLFTPTLPFKEQVFMFIHESKTLQIRMSTMASPMTHDQSLINCSPGHSRVEFGRWCHSWPQKTCPKDIKEDAYVTYVLVHMQNWWILLIVLQYNNVIVLITVTLSPPCYDILIQYMR